MQGISRAVYPPALPSQLMTARASEKLGRLCELVAARIPGSRVLVLEAWLGPPASTPLPAPSARNAGRALRLAVQTGSSQEPGLLGQLGELAAEAGFDWVAWSGPSFVYAAVRPDVCQTDVDLAFLIDGSGSMVHPTDHFSGQRRFVEEVIQYFAVQHDKTRIAALTYADNAVVNFGFAGDSPGSVEVCGSAGAVALSQFLSGGYSNNVVRLQSQRATTRPSRMAQIELPIACHHSECYRRVTAHTPTCTLFLEMPDLLDNCWLTVRVRHVRA